MESGISRVICFCRNSIGCGVRLVGCIRLVYQKVDDPNGRDLIAEHPEVVICLNGIDELEDTGSICKCESQRIPDSPARTHHENSAVW
jgi:hypothetical protein